MRFTRSPVDQATCRASYTIRQIRFYSAGKTLEKVAFFFILRLETVAPNPSSSVAESVGKDWGVMGLTVTCLKNCPVSLSGPARNIDSVVPAFLITLCKQKWYYPHYTVEVFFIVNTEQQFNYWTEPLPACIKPSLNIASTSSWLWGLALNLCQNSNKSVKIWNAGKEKQNHSMHCLFWNSNSGTHWLQKREVYNKPARFICDKWQHITQHITIQQCNWFCDLNKLI